MRAGSATPVCQCVSTRCPSDALGDLRYAFACSCGFPSLSNDPRARRVPWSGHVQIVIGGWGNRISVIRYINQGPSRGVYAGTGHPTSNGRLDLTAVSSDIFPDGLFLAPCPPGDSCPPYPKNYFWVSWDQEAAGGPGPNYLRVGRGTVVGVDEFMNLDRTDSHAQYAIRTLMASSWSDADIVWEFFFPSASDQDGDNICDDVDDTPVALPCGAAGVIFLPSINKFASECPASGCVGRQVADLDGTAYEIDASGDSYECANAAP